VLARYHGGLFSSAAPVDRYVVIGNPVAHSLSPRIHAHFARATRESIDYGRLFVERGAFAAKAREFFDAGGRGANITLPFKVEAFELATERSDRAALAGAANFLRQDAGALFADNTDGAGLVADLTQNLGVIVQGARILLVGAGGAARGVIGPLLAQAPAALVIANRSVERARELAERFASLGNVHACALDSIPESGFDLVLNATSTSTHGERLALPETLLASASFAYDMAYGPAAQAFVERARSAGTRASDGLGMLVEQAAESFFLWRGKRPSTAAILAELRTAAA
jgi:shikimate dehydrogenase